jgi:hypothetical protein
MGLVGRLEDLALPDIFHIISLTRKTGKLTLTRREGTGVVIFKNGQVVYAAADSVRDTLGNILVCQKLIAESTLIAALEAQHRSPTGKRLGTLLVEKGYLTKEILEKVIRQQIEKIIYEFLAWKNGFFKFDVSSVRDGEEVEVDAKDFLLEEGLSADYLLLEGMKRLDEQKREQTLKTAQPRPEAVPPNPATKGPSVQRKQTLSPLKAILSGIRSPAFASELTLTLMRFAADIVNRGVLFCLTKDGIRGIGQFGLEMNGTHPDELVRKIMIPPNQPSLLAEVTATRQTYRGKLQKTTWNEYLVKQLGGSVPEEVIAVPMIVDGRVVMIFYGDDLPKNRPIREIEDLELFMIHAGLAMEKNILEKRIKSFEQKSQETPNLRT